MKYNPEFVFGIFCQIDQGINTNAHFDDADVVMVSKEHYAALVDAWEQLNSEDMNEITAEEARRIVGHSIDEYTNNQLDRAYKDIRSASKEGLIFICLEGGLWSCKDAHWDIVASTLRSRDFTVSFMSKTSPSYTLIEW